MIKGTGKNINDFLNEIGKDLKITHIVALITTMITVMTSIGYVAYLLISGRIVGDFVLIVAIGSSAMVMVVYLWVSGIISGNYVSGTVNLSGATISGGQTPMQEKLGSITPGGMIFQGLTPTDASALAGLIKSGKISDEVIKALAGMTPDEIKAIIRALAG